MELLTPVHELESVAPLQRVPHSVCCAVHQASKKKWVLVDLFAGDEICCVYLLSVVSDVSPMICCTRLELKFVVMTCAEIVAIREVKVMAVVMRDSILATAIE